MTDRQVTTGSTVDAIDPVESHRCPRCGSVGTITVSNDTGHVSWGRCFKCLYYWERQP